LCGCTGLAGGMVLGPLFLTYNMVPKVMSGTNQFITMIATISVTTQFIYLGEIQWYYSIYFGLITIIAAFSGIRAINWYTKKSGKNSIILILLCFLIVMALIMLPLKFILDANK